MNVEIDPKLQKEVENIFASRGLTRDQAIKLFYEYTKAINDLPFSSCTMSKHIPNKTTVQAMKDSKAGIGERFTGIDNIKKTLKEE